MYKLFWFFFFFFYLKKIFIIFTVGAFFFFNYIFNRLIGALGLGPAGSTFTMTSAFGFKFDTHEPTTTIFSTFF